MSGWRTVEEYVRYMVPRIGYRAECAKVVRVHNAAAARERLEARRADSSPDAGETE